MPTEEYGRGLRWLAFRAHMLRGAQMYSLDLDGLRLPMKCTMMLF